MTRSWGTIALAIFLIIYAILAFTSLQLDFAKYILGGLAGASGICLLLNK